MTWSQYLFGWNAGIDELIVRDPGTDPSSLPGRMALTTAIGLLLASTAVIARKREAPGFFQASAVALGLMGGFALTSYAYGGVELYRLAPFETMALHTALSFATLSVGLLCGWPQAPLLQIVLSERPGSMLARRVWAPLVGALLVIGAAIEALEPQSSGPGWTPRCWSSLRAHSRLRPSTARHSCSTERAPSWSAASAWWTCCGAAARRSTTPESATRCCARSARPQSTSGASHRPGSLWRTPTRTRSRSQPRTATRSGLRRACRAFTSHPRGARSRTPPGKTLLCTEFIAGGKQGGERCLLFAFEESRDQLFRNASSWGLDLEDMEARGQLKLACLHPESAGLEDHLILIRDTIDEFQPDRIAADCLSSLERVSTPKSYREFVLGLTSFIKHREIATLFTATTPSLMGGGSLAETHISSITDSIVLLRYVETMGEMRRGITVLKMRGLAHDKEIREFVIDSTGMHICKAFRNVSGIISAFPQHVNLDELNRINSLFPTETRARATSTLRSRPEDPPLSKTHAIQLLLVEDNPTDSQFLKESLSESGSEPTFEITHVERLDAAMMAMRDTPFQVVLLELSLPDSSGVETFLRLQKCDPEVPVLVLASLDDPATAIEALRQGAQDFLVKRHVPTERISRAALYAVERSGFARKSAAAESEAQAATIVDVCVDSMLLVREDGTVMIANPAAAAMFGRNLTGEPFGLPLADRGTAEVDFRRRDGSSGVAEMQVARTSWRGALAYVVSLHDVTSHRRAQDEIRSLNESLERRVKERTQQLEDLNAELEAFSYSVSHDLSAPLRSILGFAEILKGEHGSDLDEDGRHCLERTIAGARRMRHLIDDLLMLSRVSRTELTVEDLDLTSLAREIWAELEESDGYGCRLELIQDQRMPAQGDRGLLRIVLLNLLGNARKFCSKRPDGRVEVGLLHDSDGSLIYFVRDNGAGFDMTQADRLFHPFQRLHNGDEFPGTGIGLATVRRIIQRHGGHIWARSEPGHGAHFSFTLGACA